MADRTDIRILSETILTATPAPGSSYRQVAITYSAPPRPPDVVFLRADQLPDLVWAQEHPGQEIPDSIRARGDRARRQAIEAQLRPSGPAPGRVLQ
jgi:hypothetical protein